MEIRILKGTNQIGGAFTEITTKKGRIIIDFGQDLDNEKKLEDIEGLTKGKKTYDGVIITHNHQDHMGRINEINKEIPVYFSDLSRKIYETAFCFSKKLGKITRETTNIEEGVPFIVKNTDIKITPYIVDHSAYNSFMLLIEAENKRILHTGDFRAHGYKGSLLVPTLKKIGKVDVLITEGTTLSRKDIDSITEKQLAYEIAEKTKDYKQVLVLMSTTNIDRVTTMQRAAIISHKKVIHDIVLSNVLQLVTQKIPNALNSKDIAVFMPGSNYIKMKKNPEEYKQYVEPFEEKIEMARKVLYQDFMMNVRVSMLKDIERLKIKNHALDNCCLIYSTWEGYKTRDENYKEFINKMDELGIKVIDIHTSGHADRKTIKKVIDIVNPEAVIPIHTEKKDMIKQFTDKAVILEDMESYIVK